jgi:CubicO group peptidase (beta-lactamase class C family)
VSSFRSTFTYTNITHLEASRIVAKSEGDSDWGAVLRKEILGPLGMTESSVTADAIEAASNHPHGYRWTPEGTVELPFTPLSPYSDQLHRRGYGALASPAARGRQPRGKAHGLHFLL